MFEYAERLARWAGALRSDAEWTSALEAAFDAVGFDEGYLSRVDPLRRNYSRIKAVKDHIWGMIEIEPADAWLLDSPLFQRMRHVRQTGFTFLTYPNAQHTRFEHSLGVYFVVKRLLATFRRTKEAYDFENRQGGQSDGGFRPTDYERNSRLVRLLLHAALVHDFGHSVFSHVSERFFASRPARLKIGGKTVEQFRQQFREKYELVDSDVQTGRRKPLAELLTVAIITSSRFERFYKLLPGRGEEEALVDLCEISSLVLGDRIERNDFALPELLSGPVDADKIDYMIRDAQACGISIGIDVARVFVRAGVYEGSASLVQHLELKGYSQHAPVKLFVIEQSGTDAVRELGAARLSLYERVYNHQLTRGAQAAFGEMIQSAAGSSDPHINKYSDYLTLWQTPEDVVLFSLGSCAEPKVSSIARSLLTRRLPKRAGCFGREFLHAPEAAVDVVSNALQDAYELRLQEFSRKVLMRLDGPVGELLLESIVQECARVRSLVDRDRPIGVRLPQNQRPSVYRLLSYPQMHDSAPPPALVIRGNRIERFGDRYFSYLYAGETSSQIGYLLVSDEWREIALLALQNVLFRSYAEVYEVVIETDRTDVNVSIKAPPLKLEALFRPSLITESVARQCKVRIGDVEAITSTLARGGYFDSAPQLSPHPISAEVETIAIRFSEFSGEQGWKIRAPLVSGFISQFPNKLRRELIELLSDNSRFLFLNRQETIRLVIEGLAKLELERPFRLVPLTPSSGQNIRNHIRGAVDPASVSVHANLSHALSVIRTNGGSVVFVDDNIASGTQAARQLEIYFGGIVEKPEGNYVIDPLTEDEKEAMCSHSIGAAFSVGYHVGGNNLAETAARFNVALSPENVVWGKAIDEVSGRDGISPGLREFLGEVGEGVLRRRFIREGHGNESDNLAHQFALGYSQLEGLVVTSFSVPTSTYPALWCPGYRETKQSEGEEDTRMPWVPLFLRTNMLKHLVLG
jgi:HD superfamily phosphohydrolase